MTAMLDRTSGIVNYWLNFDIMVQQAHRARYSDDAYD